MNATGRKTLQEIVELIQQASALLEEAKDKASDLACEEDEKYENLSEGLQQSEMGCRLQEGVDTLNEFADAIEEVISQVDDLQFNEAVEL